ncbi:MAG: T9SS type A sorting domain-containing protein, partial [Flavobacteriales bacterium]
YTGTQTVTSNMLNIAVVQNNIEGPQSGMSLNPTSILPNGNYNHSHMLRHMLTGQWGEIISTLTPGTLYSNQFTWVMPADIAGVTLDPTNIAVVAFVSEGNQEIISGTEVYPNLVFANAYDAYLASAAASNNICSDIAKGIEVVIKNYGNLPLTTLDIIYDINGGTPITFPWVGNLAPGQAATVTLSNISYIASASNTVNISVANPNGNTDQNITNDNVSTSFINQSMQGQVTTGITDGLATIDITTDGYPTESTWEIIDDNGTVIASGSATTANAPQAQATATLIAGACYAFNMYDSYGDGLSDPANGSYEVKDAAGISIASGGGNFGFLAEHFFETSGGAAASWDCDIVNGCIDPGTGTGQYTSLGACTSVCNITSIQDNNTSEFNIYPNPAKDVLIIDGIYNSVNIYDVFGKLVLTTKSQKSIDITKLSNGVYMLEINTGNAFKTKKITIAK